MPDAHIQSNRPINIVYIIARFHPFKGGAEQHCYQLATRMAEAGHHVTVLTTDASPDGQPLSPAEIHKGVKIIRCHRWNQQLNLGFYPSLLPKLLRTKADVIHSINGPGFIWAEYCMWAKKILSRRTKFVVTPHGPFMPTPETHSGFKYIVAKLGKLIGKVYFRITWSPLWHRVIQVNPKQHIWLKRDYGISQDKVSLIPNGISKELIVDRKVEIPDTKPIVITFTGRMERYKGIQQVMRALAKILPKKDLNVKFIVMGRPVYLPELVELRKQLKLDNIVEFVESPSDQIRDDILLNKSQIHILPSKWEATGIVLIEAMAKGNAIITTTENEGVEMLIEEGRNGFIYDFDDIDRLSEILTALIENTTLRKQMINLNIEKAKKLTWEAIFPKYLDIIKSVTNK